MDLKAQNEKRAARMLAKKEAIRAQFAQSEPEAVSQESKAEDKK